MSEVALWINQVGPNHVETVWRVKRACALDLKRRHGPGHWARAITLPRLRYVARTRRVYAIRDDQRIIATFSLSTTPPSFFDLGQFADPDAPATYLAGLAVLPSHQGQGIGSWCMERAEEFAREDRSRALRLDAYDAPAGAGPFYERHGYVQRGCVAVRSIHLLVYEKTLLP